MRLNVTAAGLQVLEIISYVRGYHAYMEDWTPTIGESLLVKPEPTNAKDNKAVAVLKDVGHVPYNLASRLFKFLRSKAFAEVTGAKRADYGLEIPCIYRLYGTPVYI